MLAIHWDGIVHKCTSIMCLSYRFMYNDDAMHVPTHPHITLRRIVRVVSADHKICHYPMHIVCRVVCRRLPEQSAVNRCGSRIGGSSFQCMDSLGDMQILP